MAEDMIERAAREVAKTNIPAYADEKIWAEALPMYRRRLARRDIGGVDNPIATARAALLAALDPQDHVLVEAVARGMCADLGLHADDWDADGMGAKTYKWQREADTARAAIAAIVKHAQGEQPVRSDMREKD